MTRTYPIFRLMRQYGMSDSSCMQTQPTKDWLLSKTEEDVIVNNFLHRNMITSACLSQWAGASSWLTTQVCTVVLPGFCTPLANSGVTAQLHIIFIESLVAALADWIHFPDTSIAQWAHSSLMWALLVHVGPLSALLTPSGLIWVRTKRKSSYHSYFG